MNRVTETISVSVKSLVFVTTRGDIIFSGRDLDGHRVRVVVAKRALPRPPVVGEIWKVDGNFCDHSKYGRQLYATRASYTPPLGRLITNYLASHPDFTGIGEAKAKALYETFGDQLTSILDAGDVDALQTVLTASMATRLIAAWEEHRAEAAVIVFLDKHGFDTRLANKLRRVWGVQALPMLERNPYYMLAFASWVRTDAAARKLGLALTDERRLVGAVEAALYARLQSAHTLTPAPLLRQHIADLLGVTRKHAPRALDLALLEGAVVGDEVHGYQAIGAAALESRIAERLRSMLDGESSPQFDLFKSDFGPNWLADAITENEVAQGIRLNQRQREAVLMATTKPFSVLCGGAGVGKTTVLRVVIDIAERRNQQVVQMALAGRAAKRMAEATGHEALTIAKFLHQAKHGQKLSQGALVIVDEASMLDLPSTFRILKHLPECARLLLVGDSAQLPPIGFGLVFSRLIESTMVPQVELIDVHRQAASTGIPAIAAEIRAHQVPTIGQYTGRRVGVSFIECPVKFIQSQLQRLALDWSGDDYQILGAIKDGPTGIMAVNQRFHEQCAGEDLVEFKVGEPVIHLVNDYERGLMNGTLGRVTAITDGDTPGIHIDFEGVQHFLTATEVVDRLELAYAISVHKVQGSQFRRVAVVITPSRILDHALIYTALTRGIEQVCFLGDRLVFEEAIRAPALAHLREVGFAL